MELIKKNIHMNKLKNKAVSQLTLDDDYNVPDSKPDIGKIIQQKGEVNIDEVKPTADHVGIKGNLTFRILYMSDTEDKLVHSLDGKLPFEEVMNLEGAADGDNIRLKWDLEDLSTNLINSRKLSVKTLVTFMMALEELYDEETAVEVHDDETVAFRNETMDVLQLAVSKKDTYRIKDEVVLPSNKPNIYEMLWNSVQVRGLDLRLAENLVSIKGELLLFVLYTGEDEENQVQWLETSVPFHGELECYGCNAEMIGDIEVAVPHIELEPKPDYDGEERLLNVDVVLELDMKLYEEEQVGILDDVYMPSKELKPVVQPAVFDTLLIKNFSKCRASERIRIGSNDSRILQVCHSEGDVKIDDIQVVENGIEIEGAVEVQLLYVTSDDTMPFNSMKGMVPFHHTIEAPGIDPDCVYNLRTDIEQLSTTMIDSEEIEVKLTINLNTLVLRKRKRNNIVDVEVEPLDMNKLQELPGIVGYCVQPGDSLWSIAKQYYTTVEKIMAANELASDEIKPGDKLLIVKMVESMLTA
ncbi:DUF3794 and LysM peptidoglycan-binding domain-containing protein [Diplocloster agilis]|uniref:DUF3794 domain-containing protein n=1 Tax=Diplocloster agilis TaxID=2850323 RepID=A0A949NG58_9FIRM|nr:MULTISPECIES: SPOCS domain-containing protein [Lachnospiraceae]MBU9738454.1 DUF3794 domain-containing protein [Diplocloster agilis]MBU9745055.1 DUF3794 domain-containing protein [Diplocloster agilis]MCU6735389.1 DUF3794 domain-containing protein [Suonthocola fibrivorans]SCJ72455.1 autolysin [uncultured Clostridium sp.]